jgi:hypothetical protein
MSLSSFSRPLLNFINMRIMNFVSFTDL